MSVAEQKWPHFKGPVPYEGEPFETNYYAMPAEEKAQHAAEKRLIGSITSRVFDPDEALKHWRYFGEAPSDTEKPVQEDNQTMAADLTREEMNATIKASQGEMRAEWAEFRADMRRELGEMRTEMKVGFAEIRSDMHKGFADNLKWTVGTIIAAAALAIAFMNFNKPAPVPPPAAQAPVTINMPAQAGQPPAPTPPKTN